MLRNHLIIMFLAIVVLDSLPQGCSHRVYPATEIRDSVALIVKDTTIFRDSIIYIAVPSGDSRAVVPDDSSHLETKIAYSDAWIKDGQLHHYLSNKDVLLPTTIKVPKEVHTEAKNQVNVERVVQEVYIEKQLSAWQSFRISLGTISLVCICLYLLVKLGRMAIKTWLKK